MPLMEIKTGQIADGEVRRNDLNTATSGAAVIRKLIAGNGLSLSSTGADDGTGDVTATVTGTSGIDFNYVTNPTAEADVSNWTNGTQISVARTTTTGEVLAGTGSPKISATSSVSAGAYVYASCSALYLAHRSTPNAIEFDFKALTGYDSGDCQVVLYDGTNEIVPSVTSIPGGSGHFKAVFVSTSSTSAYQVRFKSTVSSSAWDLSVDNLYVGPVRTVIEEVEVSYVTSGNGGTATSGAEADLSLNTLNNPKGYGWISGPSSDEITLSAGTYSMIAIQSFYATAETALYIKNTSDSTYLGSANSYLYPGANVAGIITATALVVFTAAKTVKLRYECASTQTTNGLGTDTGFAPDNVFTKFKIQRLGP